MKDDLVERCAEAVQSCGYGAGSREIADAVLAIARPAILEEAAKVAGSRKPLYTHPSGRNACAEIASSIRALVTTGQEGGR